MEWVRARLRETSTWVGIISGAGLLGLLFYPHDLGALQTKLLAAVGLVQTIKLVVVRQLSRLPEAKDDSR